MKKKKPNRPRVPLMRQTGQVFADRRTKRRRTRSQMKVQFKRELAGGE